VTLSMSNLFDGLTRVTHTRSARASSWDQSGRNQDYWMIPAGASVVLADIAGPGCVTHIWMTSFCRRILGPGILDPQMNSIVAPVMEIHNALGVNWEVADEFYYRKVLIKITWDDQETPSVLVPFGDFFCVGHSMPGNFASLPMSVSVKPEEQRKFGAPASLNCYFPMPFDTRARIEMINENDVPFGLYFHIDYDLLPEPMGEDVAYFHAQWHREAPCNGWGPGLQVNSPEVNVANLDGADNYVLLEAEGAGHFVGCNLSVTHFQGSWWGEGDDMIFVDGETLPSIIGTGTEDYFNHAWGMQKNAFPFNGSIIHEGDMPGYQVSYRFHITDPIRFTKSLRVTIEHGHANHLADDWASTAYWYQQLPTKPFGIAPVEQRLPLVARLAPVVQSIPPQDLRNPEMVAAVEAAEERFRLFLAAKDAQMRAKEQRTAQYVQGNIEQAQRVRNSFQ